MNKNCEKINKNVYKFFEQMLQTEVKKIELLLLTTVVYNCCEQQLTFWNKGRLTHVEVEPTLWLCTKQIMAGIKLFGHYVLCA